MQAKNIKGVIAAAEQTQTAAVAEKKKPKNPMDALLKNEETVKVLQSALKENAGAYAASILDLYNSDAGLQACNPKQVFGECLKAVSLKLPINKQLGFAYIVPYKGVPQFQIGYKGLLQLCQRTGMYRFINADAVYEGELKSVKKLTGELDLSGERISDKVIGYFAYIETLNGFSHSLYMTVDDIIKHAKKFSKSYNSSSGVWKTDFDAMAIKTVLRLLLSRYGYMSVEMVTAFEAEEMPEEGKIMPASEVIDVKAEVIDAEANNAPPAEQAAEAPKAAPEEVPAGIPDEPYPFDE